MTIRTAAPALLLAAALAACNQTSTTSGSNAIAGGTAGPVAAPQGECAVEIERFATVLRDDAASGNLAGGVYQRASADLRQADTACRAGRAVQARSIVAITRRNYGYPAE